MFSRMLRMKSAVKIFQPVRRLSNLATARRSALTERDLLYVGKVGETFSNDDTLDSLPVPTLQNSLQKYLDSVRPLVKLDEYKKTENIVNSFANGLGKDLQGRLERRAIDMKNWMEKWWEDVAYLSIRFPMIPYLNMSGSVPLEDLGLPNRERWLEKAGLQLHFQMQFWKLLRNEQLRAFMNRNAAWNMEQFRRLFNTTRIPGDVKDEIKTSFKTKSEGSCGPSHVVVFCQGYIFAFDILDDSEEPLTAPEITKQLEYIHSWCEASVEGPGIAALSANDRTIWAKNRASLIELSPQNKACLEKIDNALIVITLDSAEPNTNDALQRACLTGDCSNRWADKSSSAIVFRNGTMGGVSDHAPFDGLVGMAYGHFVYLSMQGCGGIWEGSNKVRDLAKPEKLDFNIDGVIENEIQLSKDGYLALCNNLQNKFALFTLYGKSFTKPYNIRPEAYVQIALQLAYYRLHGRPAPTYMTASTRQFYHGRTETCRTCTEESIEWVKAMEDPNTTSQTKLKLLYTAVEKFNSILEACMKGEGCDRHLLGLYLMSQEEGLQVPEIFEDSSYNKSGGGGNFILSTSCSGYTPLGGCVAPMCEQGYGAFYSIENHRMTFQLTAYNHCEETCTDKFYAQIESALSDMQQLLLISKL